MTEPTDTTLDIRRHLRSQLPNGEGRDLSNILSQVTNGIGSGILITNAGGLIVWANDAFAQMSHYQLNELVGKKPSELLYGPKTDTDIIDSIYRSAEEQKSFKLTFVNYTKDKKRYWVRKSCRPLYDGDEFLGYISTEVDVTDVKRLADFNALHAAIGQAASSTDDPSALLQSVCDLAVTHADVELAWVGVPDHSHRINFIAKAGPALPYLDDFHVSVNPKIPEGQGPSGLTWRTGAPHYSHSFLTTKSLRPWQKRAQKYALDSSASLPIFRNGKVWAVFSLYHSRSGVFDAVLRNLLERVGTDISNGLDRIDLLRQKNELLSNQNSLISQLQGEKEFAELSLSCVGDAVITTDANGYITFLNPTAMEYFDVQTSNIGRIKISDIFGQGGESDKETINALVASMIHSPTSSENSGEFSLDAGNGQVRHIDYTVAPIFTHDRKHKGNIFVFSDTTSSQDLLKTLRWHITHDELTGLPNRYALDDRLNASIEKAKRSATRFAVGLIDLDDFKAINDQYGRETGDDLLSLIAERLSKVMREGDFIARLAGDEFAVVMDNIEPKLEQETIERVMPELHKVIEHPFPLMDGGVAEIGMSMGVAIYPVDAQDGDGLLRQADVAMYSAKSDRFSRSAWWRSSAMSMPMQSTGESIDAYGDSAADLLNKARVHYKIVEMQFVRDFYNLVSETSGIKEILDFLSPEERTSLESKQGEHLIELVSPTLTMERHDIIAFRIGQIHAMIGVESSDMIAAMHNYASLLRGTIKHLPWRLDSRLALESILHTRLAREIQVQSKGRDAVIHQRTDTLTVIERDLSEWEASGEFLNRLIHQLGFLLGVNGVAIGRPSKDDTFILEYASGCAEAHFSDLEEVGMALTVNTSGPASQSWQRAWISGIMQICDSTYHDAASEDIYFVSLKHGIRSAVAIPILDKDAHPILVIVIYGAYPGLFSSSSSRMWFEAVQHVVTPVVQRLERASAIAPIDANTRQRYRELLFADGLRIAVQPIVNMSSGAVEKVEVLARIQDEGKLLSPGDFLPTYGRQELYVLFDRVLDLALSWLKRWDAANVHVDVSVNLPPNVMILPDCAELITGRLQSYQIAADRLYLELLESGDDLLEPEQRDNAIKELADIGVKLVMDDLGSGYSSLRRLRTLPFHAVKIDNSLVRHATEDPERTIPFIGSMVRMAQALRVGVVVEGLEDSELIEMACGLNAEYGQGYGLSVPLPPENLIQVLENWDPSNIKHEPKSKIGRLALRF